MSQYIQKRNGEIVPFDREKIISAVVKAFVATRQESSTEIAEGIATSIAEEFSIRGSEDILTVEEVQDRVEWYLMEGKFFDIAKTYILYREKHAEAREEKKELLEKQFEDRSLKVVKSDGSREEFDIAKIKKVFDRATQGHEEVCRFEDFLEQFKNNIMEDMRTSDINKLLVKSCVDLVSVENIAWQHVAARIFLGNLYKQAARNRNLSVENLYSGSSYRAFFDEYIEKGLYYKDFYKYYSKKDIEKAGEKLSSETDLTYEYTTVLSLAKRYLLNPNKIVKELPQEMYMSVALFLAIPEKKETRLEFAFRIYEECSKQRISLPTPTLLNARTNYHQLSSCFKINIDDDLRAIYHSIENMAQISKFGGGIGVYLGHIRSQGAMIRGVEGTAGGVNPWIKVINGTANAVNQLGARAGAISVTLDVWHRDIYDFLDLQTETGDIRSKAFDIFPAISVPDLFMRRVEEGGDWTLFDPHEITHHYEGRRLEDSFGEEFDELYSQLEGDFRLKLKTTVPARDLFKKFLKTTVETGMPYVFFRDTVNRLNPNKHVGNIYSTQLCTEICQNTSPTTFVSETLEDGEVVIRYNPGDLVVCNLASVNVAQVNDDETMRETFPVLLRILDNVITLNYYPIKEAERTAMRYRSIGIGYLGLAEYLATHKLAYESMEARKAVDNLFERYAYHTYRASVNLAKDRGKYELYKGSEYDKGMLLGKTVSHFTKRSKKHATDWKKLFVDMKKYGVRFGYHTAPAPNTSTAGVVGTTAALLPIYKKYFVETNLSSPTIRVAPKLSQENFWYYKEYISMDMADVIDMIAVVYKWIDQSISFEWMIDPTRTSPAQLYSYYMKAWKDGIKTVYYVRSLSGEVKDDCVSCSG